MRPTCSILGGEPYQKLAITFLLASFYIGLEDAELSSFRVSLLGANFLAGGSASSVSSSSLVSLPESSPLNSSRLSFSERNGLTSSSDALDGEGDMAERRRLQPLTSFPVPDPEGWDVQLWVWPREQATSRHPP